MKIGLVDRLRGDLGVGLAPFHDLEPILQRPDDVQRRDLHTEVVEPRFADQPLAQPAQPVAPGLGFVELRSEVVTARPLAGLPDQHVGVEPVGGTHVVASPLRTVTETLGGSGLSSQRNTMKPRCRPPVSNQ